MSVSAAWQQYPSGSRVAAATPDTIPDMDHYERAARRQRRAAEHFRDDMRHQRELDQIKADCERDEADLRRRAEELRRESRRSPNTGELY
jgi:hypothetical protein